MKSNMQFIMSEKESALVFKKNTGTISIEEVNVPAKYELPSSRGMFCEWDGECPFNFVRMELFQIEPNGHKFKVGDTRTLTGLVNIEEFNGQKVEITAIRKDGDRGKAYYIKGNINEKCNWVHEDRLI